MARLLYSDPGSHLVYQLAGRDVKSAAGRIGTVYEDAAGTVLADIATYDPSTPAVPGPVIGSSQLTVDSTSRLPWFWGPASGQDELWVTVNGGPLTLITSYYDPRIDALAAGSVPGTRQVIAGNGLTGGGALSADVTLDVDFGTSAGTVAAGDAPAAAVTAHVAASDPHGDRAYAVQRANHTGTQTASTISDFASAVAATPPAGHGSSHLPGGTDALTTAVAGSSAVGDSAATGTAASFSRSDHRHGREAFGTPGSSAVGDVAAAGVAATVAHSDHVHGRESFGAVTAQTSFGASSGNGAAATPSRSDHTHGTPAHGAAAHSAISLSDLAAPTGSVAWGSQKITSLANGSSAQDAAAFGQIIPASLVDAKGDLIVATADNTVARLAVGANATLLMADSAQSAGVRWVASGDFWTPADHGFFAWTYDPTWSSTSSNLTTAGTIYGSRIRVMTARNVTSINLYQGGAGTVLTSGQCFAALWNAGTGALIGVTADQSTAWAGTGTRVMNLTGGPFALAAGDYQAGFWFNGGGTAPGFGRANAISPNMTNFGTGGQPRSWSADTGRTTTAPSTLGALSFRAEAWFIALA